MNTEEHQRIVTLICPFCKCGNCAVWSDRDEGGDIYKYWVECDSCSARGPDEMEREGAIRGWLETKWIWKLEDDKRKSV